MCSYIDIVLLMFINYLVIVLFVETFHKQNYYIFYRHANVQRTNCLVFKQFFLIIPAKASDDKFIYQGDILMSVNNFQPPDQQTRKKRAVIAFEYFHWNVDQGVPYKLHESLDGEFLFNQCNPITTSSSSKTGKLK